MSLDFKEKLNCFFGNLFVEGCLLIPPPCTLFCISKKVLWGGGGVLIIGAWAKGTLLSKRIDQKGDSQPTL
jgi:hypothetical protein